MNRTKQIFCTALGFVLKLLLLGMFSLSVSFLLSINFSFLKSTLLAGLILILLAAAVLFLPMRFRSGKKIQVTRAILIALLTVFSLPVSLTFLLYNSLNMHYIPVETGFFSSSFFDQPRVLVIAPHEDDEVNIAGPLIESMTSAGADVSVIYLTAGDYYGIAALRQEESANAMEMAGVPEDHLYFLGYGDQWQGTHLYNSPEDVPLTSYIGKGRTYGTERFPDFATKYRGAPNLYTRANALQDLKDCIVMLRPDVIFCADYDVHADHRATSLLFEEVMGQLLAEDPQWRPQVFKSISYFTCWMAPKDFYQIPLAATPMPSGEPYPLGTPSYRWEERVRFPVPGQFLTYSVEENEFNRLYHCFLSQEGSLTQAPGAANSDIVFFQRSTDSLLYGAVPDASSGDAALLNDYKLFDTSDVNQDLYDLGVWRPTDEDKTVRFTFPEPVSMNCVSLWDDPDPAVNVLGAELLLSDGTVVKIPALDPAGGENQIFFPQRDNIRWAQLQITDGTGLAGITEMELALRGDPEPVFVKLQDSTGNFLYNAPVAPGEENQLSLYSWPALPRSYTFTAEITDSSGAPIASMQRLSPDNIPVSLPKHGTYHLKVTCEQDPNLTDECVLYTRVSPFKAYVLPEFEPCYFEFLEDAGKFKALVCSKLPFLSR